MPPPDPDQFSTETLKLIEKATEGPSGWNIDTSDERSIAEMVSEDLGEAIETGILLNGRGIELLRAMGLSAA